MSSLPPDVLDAEAVLSERGLTWKHFLYGFGLRIIELLERLTALTEPNNYFTLNGTAKISAGATTGYVAFRSNDNETWRVGRYTFKSQGGHTAICEVYSDAGEPRDLNSLINLVDTSLALTESTSDNAFPVIVQPGSRIVFVFSSATAGDSINVTLQGVRERMTRPHRIAAPYRAPRRNTPGGGS